MQIFTYELTGSELMNWQDNVIVQFRKKWARVSTVCTGPAHNLVSLRTLVIVYIF